MIRIMVLAMALAFLPAFALANTPQSALRTANAPVPAVRIPAACTPANPCAVPPPAIGSLEIRQRETAKDRAAPRAR